MRNSEQLAFFSNSFIVSEDAGTHRSSLRRRVKPQTNAVNAGTMPATRNIERKGDLWPAQYYSLEWDMQSRMRKDTNLHVFDRHSRMIAEEGCQLTCVFPVSQVPITSPCSEVSLYRKNLVQQHCFHVLSFLT